MLLAWAVLPLVLLFLAWRVGVRRRPIAGIRDKFTGQAPAVPAGSIVVHGVSLGEVGLMRPLVGELARRTGAPLLLTTSTGTGWEALQRHFPDQAKAFWPFDLPWAVELFLGRVRPRAVVLLELEFWPLVLCACRRRGIATFVVNGRMSARSFRRFRALRPLVGPLFRSLALVLAQNAEWGARFRALGAPQVRVSGTMKADTVRPADAGQRAAEARRLGLLADQPVCLLASTGPGEEAGLLRAWSSWGPAKGWRLVVCPRHPERGPDVVAACHRLGLSCHRTSQGPPPAAGDTVLIVDELGRLAALYALADLAVVGGGLGSGRGGQNMLEAAAAGCCTLVGPDIRNQPDAMALLRSRNAVLTIQPDDHDGLLAALAIDPARRRHLGQAARQAWEAGRGAAARSLTHLVPLLTVRPRRVTHPSRRLLP